MSEQNKLSDHDRKEIEKFKKYCSREMQGVEKLKYQGFNNEQIITIQEKEITALKSQLERVKGIAKKVCEFYGNRDNWNPYQCDGIQVLIDDNDTEMINLNENEGAEYGGKLARECMKELGE